MFVFRKFVLLSESCIPLYPPEVIYSQLLSEKKSRMRSCRDQSNVALKRFVQSAVELSNWISLLGIEKQ